eukprot:g37911.t1
MAHIDFRRPYCPDPLQFACWSYRSTADTIFLVLHSCLEHLDNKDTCIRPLLIVYSSTFDTIIPNNLISELRGRRISKSDKTEYRKKIECMAAWYKDNNLSINVSKMKELIIDLREWSEGHTPVCINDAEVEMVESVEFW